MCLINLFYVQVNNNGIISFENSFSSFTPRSFPALGFGTQLIAPYWADADTRESGRGTVFYRQTTNLTLLQRASTEIQDGLSVSFFPSHLFIATWDSISFFGFGGFGPDLVIMSAYSCNDCDVIACIVECSRLGKLFQ